MDTALSHADVILAQGNNAKLKHWFSKQVRDYTKVMKLQEAAEQATAEASAEGDEQGEMFVKDGILHNSDGSVFKAPEGFLLVVEEDPDSPGTQIYKLVSYDEAAAEATMLARSTLEPSEGPSALVSPAKSGLPTAPAPTPAQTAPGSPARSVMLKESASPARSVTRKESASPARSITLKESAPGSPSKSSTPILTVTRTPSSCKHFSADMGRFWQAKSKQQDHAHRICQELETRHHARKKISCHPTTPQTIELAKGKGCLLSFFATDTTKVTIVTADLRSPPKVSSDIGFPDICGKYSGGDSHDKGEGCAGYYADGTSISASAIWGHYSIVTSQHSFDAAHPNDGPTSITIAITAVTIVTVAGKK